MYAFDDIAIVPSRRTRIPEDMSVTWTIDAYTFDIPVLAAPMDSVVSPTTATTGYSDLKEFQRDEVVVTPYRVGG